MSERVQPLGLNVWWEPNAPEAVLLSNDLGRTAMSVRAHPDDPDERQVVLLWTRVEWAAIGAPNDDALALRDVRRVGLVQQSGLIADLRRQASVHPMYDAARFAFLNHYVVVLKECVAKVVARSIGVHRGAGSTLDAGVAALRGVWLTRAPAQGQRQVRALLGDQNPTCSFRFYLEAPSSDALVSLHCQGAASTL